MTPSFPRLDERARRTPSIRTGVRVTVAVLLLLINALIGLTVWGQQQAADLAIAAVADVESETIPLSDARAGAGDFAILVGTLLFAPTVDIGTASDAADRVEHQIRALEAADLGEAQALTDEAIAGWRRYSPILLTAVPGDGLGDPAVVDAIRNILIVADTFAAARTVSLEHVGEHLATARTQQYHSILVVILTAGGCGLSVLLAAFVLSRALLRPVRRMQSGVATIASGDLEHRLPVDGPAELAELAEAFNAMAGDLQDRERQLVYRALHDPLTGCGNRVLLHDRLEQRLAWLQRHPEHHLAVLLLDLDGFKAVNDTLGHSVGDEALRIACDRIRPLLRPSDTLVRLGGDEFAILVDGDTEEAALVAERVCGRLRERMVVANQPITLTASVGVSTTHEGAHTVEDLLRHADIAMYAAKRAGGDRVEPFVRVMDERLSERRSLVEELRHAVALDQIEIHYQPTVTLDTQEILGVEALVRWRHPRHGLLEPGRFLDIAEETGLIVPIGWHVLHRATRDAAPWAALDPNFVLSVNVSARQLQQDGLAAEIANALEASGLPATQLMLEITETALLRNVKDGAEQLRPVHDLGVRIALDDFGTGYRSLYLGTLPVDTLKIDRSFVDGLADREDQRSLVQTIMDLAARMNCEVIAEGIEQVGDADALRTLGCRTGQGFAYYRPSPRDDIDTLMGLERPVDRLQLAATPGSAP